MHIQPGLEEHQNWVEFPVPLAFSGYFALCLDGQQLEQGGGDLEFPTGVARFNLLTTWADLAWLHGELDAYHDLQRWELRLVCDPRTPC